MQRRPAASNAPRLYAFYDNLIARLLSPCVFQPEDGQIPKRSTSGLRPLSSLPPSLKEAILKPLYPPLAISASLFLKECIKYETC